MSARSKFLLSISMALFASSSYAADFTVTKVIRIGEGKWSIIPGQIKFSPDGSHISFLNGPFLMVADSTGVASEVMTIQGRLLAYEWLTDSQIVVHEYDRLNPPKGLHRLALANIYSGLRKVVREYVRPSEDSTQRKLAFKGLFRAQDGTVYTKSDGNNDSRPLQITEHGRIAEVTPSPAG